MSRTTRWPHGPWFRAAAVVLSVAALVWFVRIKNRHMPTVEREDLAAYIRVSLPAIPFWRTYTVLETPKGEFAVPSDTGVLYRTKIKADRQKLRSDLATYVYCAPLWRVLLWPLIGFAIVLMALAKLASALDQWNNGDRLIQGAPIVSHWRWNLPLWFRRSQRGFFIETK